MRIQRFIFSLFVFVFFDVIQASEDSVSVNQLEKAVSVDQVEPHFSHLLNSFFYQNIDKIEEVVPRSDILLTAKLFQNFPFQTLKVVNSFGSREFNFFFAALIHSEVFASKSVSRTGGRSRCDDIDFTFHTLDYLIGVYIEYSLGGSNLISSKDMILELLPILKNVGCSPSVNILAYFCCTHFKSETMSTKVFIHSYVHFIEGLEDDCVIGFEKAYNKLKHLSIQYGGVIPSQEDSKSRIFSLILSCGYYAKIIESKIFAPIEPETTDSLLLESETTDSSPLKSETTDPGTLSFFLGLFQWNSLESLFFSCGSVDKEFVREFYKGYNFIEVLDKYKIESHQTSSKILES